jgi:F-type H+-transporting ATPase subunit b
MEILDQFGINPLLLAAQVVNFFILLFILKKLLYNPLLKVLDARKYKIEESLKNAEEIERRLQETSEQVEEMLTKASNEAQKIISEAKSEIEIIKEEGRQKADEIATQIIKRGEETVAQEMVRKEQELMTHISEIVTIGIEKVIGKSFNKKDQLELIEKEVKNLS